MKLVPGYALAQTGVQIAAGAENPLGLAAPLRLKVFSLAVALVTNIFNMVQTSLLKSIRVA